MVVEELVTRWGFKVDNSGLNKIKTTAKSLSKTFVALTAVSTAVYGAISAMVNSASKYGDEIAKASQRVGVNTDALQKLRYAADLANVGSEELNMGLMRLSRTILDARNGNKDLTNSLNKAGISIDTINNKSKSADELIAIMSDRFKAMPDGVEKTALAMDLFGRSGARLIPLLNSGSKNIKAMYQEAKDLGIILDESVLRSSEEFRDNLTRLTVSLTAIKNKIGLELMPKIDALVTRFLAWYKVNQNLVGQRIDKTVDLLTKAFNSASWVFENVIGKIITLSDKLIGFENVIKILTVGWLAKLIIGINGVSVAATAMWAKIIGPLAVGGLAGALLSRLLKVNVAEDSRLVKMFETPAVPAYSRASRVSAGVNNININIPASLVDNPKTFTRAVKDELEQYLSNAYGGE